MNRYATPTDHLPDPVTQAEFYADVTLKRALAWVIDSILILALVVPVVVMTAFIGLFFLPFLFLVVGFVYRAATIAGGSATWGMRLMAIELRDAYGRRLDGGTALLHTLGYTVSMSIPLIQFVSIVTIVTSERGQSLTDMGLGTAMINRRA
ncbi:RDD family protein [Aestuariicoccus sp. MJ-SS9]|uniref:RDD family protein n=1 Tax=Aestuariicoccus sp. MJ-SS9 TaxID=3079855 RepID=UPI002913D19C|nr:RDD family protein [Aestuariicoccus sp. MJ-SS9]MDU8911273.1 RDD family protein [Aestuariicoccus sp. MJ-SS9]